MKWTKLIFNLLLLVFAACYTQAQTDNKSVIKANKLYKEGKFEEAIAEYRKAAQASPDDEIIQYNLGNAVFKKESFDEALAAYDKSIELSKDNSFREKNVYNKGVSYTRQKKLLESIASYKEALKIDPTDADARHNLQKALHELRQQNQPKDNKEDQQKKQQQQQKKKQPKEQSNFNRKQVEQLMKALRQKEQDIQQKMQQNRTRATTQPDKDW